jgi:hypothetical protein
MDLKLISTVICDDVLRNPGGWLSLYTLFREVYADAYPTTLVRMHVVTTWLNESARTRQVIQRVAVLSPEGELVADQAARFDVGPGAYHTQITRFLDTVFIAPGTYRVQVLRLRSGQVQAGTEIVADLPLFLMPPVEAAKEPVLSASTPDGTSASAQALSKEEA